MIYACATGSLTQHDSIYIHLAHDMLVLYTTQQQYGMLQTISTITDTDPAT
jgi:hypothetical protein